MTPAAPAAPGRDLRAELVHREFTGWIDAQSWPLVSGPEVYTIDQMAEAFTAGMDAQRDLTAATGYGTLAERITRLAEAWGGVLEVTERGQLLRDLGQVLRDELGYASDKPQVTQ